MRLFLIVWLGGRRIRSRSDAQRNDVQLLVRTFAILTSHIFTDSRVVERRWLACLHNFAVGSDLKRALPDLDRFRLFIDRTDLSTEWNGSRGRLLFFRGLFIRSERRECNRRRKNGDKHGC